MIRNAIAERYGSSLDAVRSTDAVAQHLGRKELLCGPDPGSDRSRNMHTSGVMHVTAPKCPIGLYVLFFVF